MTAITSSLHRSIAKIPVLRAVIAFDAALIVVVAVFFLWEQNLESQSVVEDVAEILKMEARFIGDHVERTYDKASTLLGGIEPEELGMPYQNHAMSLIALSSSNIDPAILVVGFMASGQMNVIYRRSDASLSDEMAVRDVAAAHWVNGPFGHKIALAPGFGNNAILIRKAFPGTPAAAIALIKPLNTMQLLRPLSFLRTPSNIHLRLVRTTPTSRDKVGDGTRGEVVALSATPAGTVSGGVSDPSPDRPRTIVATYLSDSVPIETAVSASMSDILPFTFRHQVKMAWLSLGVAASLIFLTCPILFYVVRPLAKLRKSIVRIAGGDLDHPVANSVALADIYEAGYGAELMRRSLRDLTSRLARQVEVKSLALQERQAQLDLAMESIEQGILMLDKQGRIVVCNRAFILQLGLSEKLARPGTQLNALVRHFHQIPRQRSDWRGSLHTIFRCVREGTDSFYTLTDPSGRYFEVHQRPIANGAVCTLIDVTDRQRAHRHLLMIASEATRANEAKTHFLGNMSHELRTPLNAIIGFSQMIESACFGPVGHERYSEYASAIRTSGEYLLSLTEDLLDTAKIEAGSNILHEESVDLRYVLRWIESQLRQQAVAGAVTLLFHPVVPGLNLRADGVRIRQAILNVVGNAIKFTQQGGRVDVLARVARDGKLEIVVSDSGIGIPQEDISRITLPFEQVETRLTRHYKGAGLGLPLAKGLIELHGGRLRIASTLGKGTAVTMTIPQERIEN